MSGMSSRFVNAVRVLGVVCGLIMLGVASGSGGHAATGYRIPLPSPVPVGGTPLDEFTDFANAAFRGTLINRWQVPLGSNPWSEPYDTGTPWSSGGGMWEVKTRYGPGFRFVVTDDMRVA